MRGVGLDEMECVGYEMAAGCTRIIGERAPLRGCTKIAYACNLLLLHIDADLEFGIWNCSCSCSCN